MLNRTIWRYDSFAHILNLISIHHISVVVHISRLLLIGPLELVTLHLQFMAFATWLTIIDIAAVKIIV